MTVLESLQLQCFSSAKVVAGRGGLERSITGVMVLEATDIEHWGRRGQMLITSFYALQDLNARQMEQFFEKLSAIGISALVFKADRLVRSVPEGIVSLSEQQGIPLLQISRETRYESILMDVLGNILDSNLTLLNRFFDVHSQMMTLALQQPTVLQILTYLKDSIHAESTLLEIAGDRRITSDRNLGSFTRLEMTEAEPNRYQHHSYYSAALSYPGGIADRALAVPVPSSDDRNYFLIVHSGCRTLQSIDIMTIENVVSLLQMEILKQNAIEQQLFIENNNIIRDLLNSRYTSHEKIDHVLEQLGLGAHTHYQALMICIHLPSGEEENRAHVMKAVRRRVKSIYPSCVYLESSDQITFLRSFGGEPRASWLEEVSRRLEKLPKETGIPKFTYLAAQSSTCDRYSIGKINREVTDICRLFDGVGTGNRCVRYEDLGIYKLFLGTDNPERIRQYLDPRLLALRESAPEFFETLTALCENNLNYQETARKLYLHPKTVRYRALRVRQMTGLDVHNSDDLLQVLFAQRLLRLLDG